MNLAQSRNAHLSWAKTPDRTARTRNARAASPTSVQWHLDRQEEPLRSRPMADRIAAAESARTAWMKDLTARSIKARQAKVRQGRAA